MKVDSGWGDNGPTKKAVILGISGQDGAYLAQFLIQKGYQVYGTSRDVQMASFRNLMCLGIRDKVKLFSVAINDFRSVLQLIIKVQPDEIYNLAGQSSVALSFEQPVETFESISVGSLNLLESIRFCSKHVKLYNACSSECFGNTDGQAADELTPFRPRSPYGVAKAAAFWGIANYREAYGLFACSGLLFNHESPFRPERFVTKKIVATACRIAKGSKQKLILGSIDIQRDWGWAPEYVQAMWLMLQQDNPDDYVIATGETNSLQDFIKAVFAEVNLNWSDHVEHHPDLLRLTEILTSRANPQKAREKMGWRANYKMINVVKMMVEAEMQALLD